MTAKCGADHRNELQVSIRGGAFVCYILLPTMRFSREENRVHLQGVLLKRGIGSEAGVLLLYLFPFYLLFGPMFLVESEDNYGEIRFRI